MQKGNLSRDTFRKILKAPILITGARGMLGTDLTEFFVNLLGNDWVVVCDRQTLDICNSVSINKVLSEVKPSWIVNAAAFTDVDGAEKNRVSAKAINSDGPKYLAETAKAIGSRVFHFSTDYVFNGESPRPRSEEDATCPPQPNYYGETKLAGENAVRAFPENVVLRVQWLYGKKKDRFTALTGKTVFTPFIDQFGAPQWTREISLVTAEMMARNPKGLFHFSYDDYASWFEVYQFVKEVLQLQVDLQPKKSAEIALPARRPQFGMLSNKKLLAFLGWKQMGSWKDPLKEFLLSR